MTSSSGADLAAPSGTLVLGYGNTLRRDDALGVLAAEAISARAIPGVRVLTAFQLLPELADPIAAAERVVFVDARADAPDACVTIERLGPADPDGDPGRAWTHSASPALVLHLAEHVFGHRPEAWMVSIPATDLEHGEGLSDAAAAALDEAVRLLLGLLGPGTSRDA